MIFLQIAVFTFYLVALVLICVYLSPVGKSSTVRGKARINEQPTGMTLIRT